MRKVQVVIMLCLIKKVALPEAVLAAKVVGLEGEGIVEGVVLV